MPESSAASNHSNNHGSNHVSSESSVSEVSLAWALPQNRSTNLDIQSSSNYAPSALSSNAYSSSPSSSSVSTNSSHLAVHSVRQYSTPAPLIASRPSSAITPSNHKIVDLDGPGDKFAGSVISSSSNSSKDAINGKSPYLNVNCDILSSSSKSADKGRK